MSLTVGPRSRIGVVGPNGAGKSTLLKILAGIERYTVALDRFTALGGDTLEARAATECASLGLPPDRLHVAVGALSGGQAARAALAAILLSRYDVLLLDEPTNDLDFAGLARLERFLAETQAAVVVVSHDRALLEHAVERVFQLEAGGRGSREFGGGWAEYLALRRAARHNEAEAYAAYAAERDRLKGQVQQKREWAAQGASKVKKSGETDKFIRHHKTATSEKQAGKARMSERRLERLEKVDKPREDWELQLSLEAASRSGEVVFRLQQAVMARGMNCLVLDEPTNHLDPPAIEQLERALGQFDGTLLLVTHDRRLLEHFEPTTTVDLG